MHVGVVALLSEDAQSLLDKLVERDQGRRRPWGAPIDLGHAHVDRQALAHGRPVGRLLARCEQRRAAVLKRQVGHGARPAARVRLCSRLGDGLLPLGDERLGALAQRLRAALALGHLVHRLARPGLGELLACHRNLLHHVQCLAQSILVPLVRCRRRLLHARQRLGERRRAAGATLIIRRQFARFRIATFFKRLERRD
eukprot:5345032-Pleurochrysis_carterae.AAC.1